MCECASRENGGSVRAGGAVRVRCAFGSFRIGRQFLHILSSSAETAEQAAVFLTPAREEDDRLAGGSVQIRLVGCWVLGAVFLGQMSMIQRNGYQ